MKSSSRAFVHHLLASRLQIDRASIDDAQPFEALGLTLLDLVLVAARLEHFDHGDDDFPFAGLKHARTVGDLVSLVDLWLRADTTRNDEATGSRDTCAKRDDRRRRIRRSTERTDGDELESEGSVSSETVGPERSGS